MELQERAAIHEFMSGSLADPLSGEVAKDTKDYSNQILDYLMGFSPNIAIPEETTDSEE